MRKMFSVVAVAALAGAASAAVFTNQAAFVAQLQPGFFFNAFNSVAAGPSGPLAFSGGGFSYTISTQPGAVSGLYNDPGVISTDNAGDQILVTFTSGNVTAVGGNMWSTDILVQPVASTVTITLSDGQTRVFNSTLPTDFTGFTSGVTITSILIDAGNTATGGPAWPTLDNLYVGRAIPAPGAAAAFGLVGLAGLRRRR